MGKAPGLGPGAFFDLYIHYRGLGRGLCNGYLVLFVWVGRVWGLTFCFASVFRVGWV